METLSIYFNIDYLMDYLKDFHIYLIYIFEWNRNRFI